ncbi:MAG: acetylglucosamine-6-sulfatase, partial [Opitutales bacterium]
YDLQNDHEESTNLIAVGGREKLVARLSRELDRLIEQANHGRPDHMPMDEGIKGELPDEKIR